MTVAETPISEECLRWDRRYAEAGLFFGAMPTPLLVKTLASPLAPVGLPRRALCIGEGEGRDAIFLAREGWTVTAVDGSQVGLAKLKEQAAAAGVEVAVLCRDLADYVPTPGSFELVTSIYCHLPEPLRRLVFAHVAAALTPGGLFVVEGFSLQQLRNERPSGGPRAPELLYQPEVLASEIGSCLELLELGEQTIEIEYGRHRGPADVVRCIARAPRLIP